MRELARSRMAISSRFAGVQRERMGVSEEIGLGVGRLRCKSTRKRKWVLL